MIAQIEAVLDRNGLEEFESSFFDFQERSGVRLTERLAGDGIINERDGCRYCLGCVACESSLEDEI